MFTRISMRNWFLGTLKELLFLFLTILHFQYLNTVYKLNIVLGKAKQALNCTFLSYMNGKSQIYMIQRLCMFKNTFIVNFCSREKQKPKIFNCLNQKTMWIADFP